ncbi:SGNH/GDSL hydrolase family protein [Paractinoplanes rishiriensis]|uniref:Hydrolase n=1 Tax=Paractinoplanes rishiriensis TaxID=1050105 RepID=A0A919JT76_9ACTN|nr:SGNH/GDSL hydrolase family protein [Actinoplanes rishiriensis]GIE92937.1 hydrolase [Actinoplanes rishiriensis]
MSRRHFTLGCVVTTTLLSLAIATPAAATATTLADVDYAALGDSYSSGVGAPGQTGSCLRSPYGYAALWAARNNPTSFTNLTCGGAVTGDVLSRQVPQLPSGADLISITIGGNDAGFAPTVLTCQFASDAECQRTVAEAETDIGATLGGKLDNTYAAIKRKAPDAQVIVLGYPLLFDTASASCGAGMSLAKRRALNHGAQVLNDLIKARVEAAGLTFSDVRDEFAGHGICASGAYLNGLTILPPQNSFHPNRNGYTYGYLPAMIDALG